MLGAALLFGCDGKKQTEPDLIPSPVEVVSKVNLTEQTTIYHVRSNATDARFLIVNGVNKVAIVRDN